MIKLRKCVSEDTVSQNFDNNVNFSYFIWYTLLYISIRKFKCQVKHLFEVFNNSQLLHNSQEFRRYINFVKNGKMNRKES